MASALGVARVCGRCAGVIDAGYQEPKPIAGECKRDAFSLIGARGRGRGVAGVIVGRDSGGAWWPLIWWPIVAARFFLGGRGSLRAVN